MSNYVYDTSSLEVSLFVYAYFFFAPTYFIIAFRTLELVKISVYVAFLTGTTCISTVILSACIV
jgi:hypothetical protein